MVAKVKSLLVRKMCKSISSDCSIADINESFLSIQESINFIVEKINSRGKYMDALELESVGSIKDIVDVTNRNVSKINSFIIEINNTLKQEYMISKEVLSVMGIDAINNFGTSTFTIKDDSIDISISNGQTIKIENKKISSSVGDDTQVIEHVV